MSSRTVPTPRSRPPSREASCAPIPCLPPGLIGVRPPPFAQESIPLHLSTTRMPLAWVPDGILVLQASKLSHRLWRDRRTDSVECIVHEVVLSLLPKKLRWRLFVHRECYLGRCGGQSSHACPPSPAN